MAKTTDRKFFCKIYTDVELPYRGHGRPPVYCKKAKAEIEAQRRKNAYKTKRTKAGKSYTPRDAGKTATEAHA